MDSNSREQAMLFDPRHQNGKDGTLTKSVRVRLQKLREKGFTLKDIGDQLGFSGPFISQLLNEKSPGRVRSIHVAKMIQSIERAEAVNGIANHDEESKPSAESEMSLEQLMRAIEAKGFEVTVKPK
jgi:predicted transcriptional regulator